MEISYVDIQSPGVSDRDARRVIAYARTIAPCLDALLDEPRADAIAILQSVAVEVAARGNRHVESQTIGPARVKYVSVSSVFGADDRAALRGICGAAQAAALPVGSFPAGSAVGNVWPEVYP